MAMPRVLTKRPTILLGLILLIVFFTYRNSDGETLPEDISEVQKQFSTSRIKRPIPPVKVNNPPAPVKPVVVNSVPAKQEEVVEKVNAAYVILCRESDLDALKKTLRNLEETVNKKFKYPYVLMNNNDFSENFKKEVRSVISAKAEFVHTLPGDWEYPSHINQTYAAERRKKMEEDKIIYGGSEPYRFMCRYYSGLFFRHPAVSKYEYYWRVEPGVEFYCDIEEDPFLFMKRNKKTYGYTVFIHEYMETIPTLWKHSNDWAKKNIKSSSIMPFFLNDKGEYNGCHFWTNFEIARVDLWNNPQYSDFFEHLDQSGGFFYERWGDAPVHAVYLALTQKREQLHFFKNIGYYHPGFMQCDSNDKKCKCPKDKTNISEAKGYSCLYEWFDFMKKNDVTPWTPK